MMGKYACEIMEDPKKLAKFQFCSEENYRDFFALQKGEMREAEFVAKYRTKAALLSLDMTGFTRTTIEQGELQGLLLIIELHKFCGPVFNQYDAHYVRAFADNFVALFDNPNKALDCAFEIHHRFQSFTPAKSSGRNLKQCCIGIGYGTIYTIGIDKAMGDEMNRTSKLGEDIAKGSETLITEGAFAILNEREDCLFQSQTHDEIPFPFYEVLRRKNE
jgi:class 3 adenylate cyclase